MWDFCQGFIRDPRRGRRLFIYGNNGCGKTKACRAVRRWVVDRAMDMPMVQHDNNYGLADFIYVNWPMAVKQFQSGDWDIEDMRNTNLLILDDIGAEHDPSKAGVTQLYLLLERREWRWTMITSNYSPGELEHRLERRITDRLFRNCDHVDLSEVPSFAATV